MIIKTNSTEPQTLNITKSITLNITLYDPKELLGNFANDYVRTFLDEAPRLYKLSGTFTQKNSPYLFDGTGRILSKSRDVTVNYNLTATFKVNYTTDINKITPNTHVMTVVEHTNVWLYGGKSEASGANYGYCSIVSRNKYTGLEFAVLMLHELSHDFKLDDKYTEFNPASGNLMGAAQSIRGVKLTIDQQKILAMQILMQLELIQMYGGYDKWVGSSAKSRAR